MEIALSNKVLINSLSNQLRNLLRMNQLGTKKILEGHVNNNKKNQTTYISCTVSEQKKQPKRG